MDCSTLSFPVLHYLPEFAQSHIHWWRRQWQPTPVLLPGKSHGRRNLVGCSPWGSEESDTTEWLHFYFSLSCIGEGTGNPLQCSCLENPKDRGAWWAAVYGVAQSRTRLKWLSSSSSSIFWEPIQVPKIRQMLWKCEDVITKVKKIELLISRFLCYFHNLEI